MEDIVACSDCGPRVSLLDRHGRVLGGDWGEEAQRLLEAGKIIAVKGLGGFHLACNGLDAAAVQRLRRRKGRPARPLAVMCRDLAVVRKYCSVSPREEALLCSPAAPVVVLAQKRSSTLPRALAPGLKTIGVILPYTPLHTLLMQKGPPVLVMTSGNRRGLPIVKDNRQALSELDGVADYFLLHDRDIVNRCDDSVVWLVGGQVQFLRRSRGFVPQPVAKINHGEITVLGAGGDLKNTFCLFKGGQAYLSQHIGSMDTLEGAENYQSSLASFCDLIQARPLVVGCDPHPYYHSSKMARALVPTAIAVQHHHAHMAACMAEHGLEGQVIGVILDGTGYGLDGYIWGFEVLQGDYLDFSRQWHLEYTPLPGGERAVHNPWVTAMAYLITALGEPGHKVAQKLFPTRQKDLAVIAKMLQAGINSPFASSCGRFFDAVAALLGICLVNTYDGQAAIELGELVPTYFNGLGKDTLTPYPFTLEGGMIKTSATIVALVQDIEQGYAPTIIARRFHDTIVRMVVQAVDQVRSQSGLDRVVLGGGCWYNRYLLTAICQILGAQGYKVYWPSKVPTGDGGISLGQAMVATRKYMASRETGLL